MEFPKVWERSKWRIPEDQNSINYWHEFKNGDRRIIALKTVYKRIGRKDEAVLEFNILDRGAAIQMWFSGVGGKNEKAQSRIMKNGRWVYGAPNEKVSIDGLISVKSGRFRGIRVQLKSVSGEIITADIYKRGCEPKPEEISDLN